MLKVKGIEVKKGYSIKFSEGIHQYRDDKGVVPSVTTIIGILNKPALMGWAARITAEYLIKQIPRIKSGKVKFTVQEANRLYSLARTESMRESKKAMAIGTKVHAAVERYIKTGKGLKGRVNKQVKNAFDAFLVWKEEVGIGSVVAVEQVIYSKKHGYAGTLDLAVNLRREGEKEYSLYIVDLKSSKAFYEPDMPMQVAAYAYALMEMSDVKVDGIGILRLDKETGQPAWRDYSELMAEYFDMFKTLCKFENKKRATRKAQKVIEKGKYNE